MYKPYKDQLKKQPTKFLVCFSKKLVLPINCENQIIETKFYFVLKEV